MAATAWITQKLVDAARWQLQCRLVSMLEGGYALKDLAASTATHVRGLMAGV